jgi:hypothetical protein
VPPVPDPELPLVPELPEVPPPVAPPVAAPVPPAAPLVPGEGLGALGTTVPPLLEELELLELLVLVPDEVICRPHSLKP